MTQLFLDCWPYACSLFFLYRWQIAKRDLARSRSLCDAAVAAEQDLTNQLEQIVDMLRGTHIAMDKMARELYGHAAVDKITSTKGAN